MNSKSLFTVICLAFCTFLIFLPHHAIAEKYLKIGLYEFLGTPNLKDGTFKPCKGFPIKIGDGKLLDTTDTCNNGNGPITPTVMVKGKIQRIDKSKNTIAISADDSKVYTFWASDYQPVAFKKSGEKKTKMKVQVLFDNLNEGDFVSVESKANFINELEILERENQL